LPVRWREIEVKRDVLRDLIIQAFSHINRRSGS
jgi:hypothetical protein